MGSFRSLRPIDESAGGSEGFAQPLSSTGALANRHGVLNERPASHPHAGAPHRFRVGSIRGCQLPESPNLWMTSAGIRPRAGSSTLLD